MGYVRTFAATASVGIAAIALVGCGGGSPTSTATSPGSASSNSSLAPSASAAAPAANTPADVSRAMIGALRTRNERAFCAAIAPDERQVCTTSELAQLIRSATVSDVAFHQTVISGDRALVSITGKLCLAGHCQGTNDPNSGMPSSTVTFNQAWAIAFDPNTPPTAGSPCEKINGRWYAVFPGAQAPSSAA